MNAPATAAARARTRSRKIDREVAKYPPDQKQSAVMAALAIAQDENGWLSTETMDFVAQYLGMPPVAVYEVASFYTMYNLKPVGRYKLTICTNLPCALQGANAAAEHLKRTLGIGFNETTRRRRVHAEGRRVLGRLRRRAGAARQQQAHVQLDDAGQARRAARRADVRSASAARCRR